MTRIRRLFGDLRIGLRANAAAKGRLVLALAALALGVGLGFAVHLINRTAIDEFAVGLRSLSGGADLVVRGPRTGFDADLYPRLARLGFIAAVSPIAEVQARLAGREETLTIIGLDVFRALAVQPALLPIPRAGSEPLTTLRPDSIFLAESLAQRLAIRNGDRLRLQSGLVETELEVRGSLPADIRRPPVAVMDVAGALALAGTERLSRLDVRLRPGVSIASAKAEIAALLPPGVKVDRAQDIGATEATLTRSYRVNLTVLALVALFTGSLLVFSTQALAVIRRRIEFALLRALGMTPAELVVRLLGEAAVAGAIGSLFGLLIGYALALGVTRLFGADLGAGFFRGVTPRIEVAPIAAIVFFLLGVLASVLGALGPALEAARILPSRALRAGDDETVFERVGRIWPSTVALAAGALLAFAPPVGGLPIFGYVAIGLVLIGTILAMPRLANLAFNVAPMPREPVFALALAQLRGAPGQPAVSLAAIVAAVSLAVSMALMVASFRGSLVEWLERLLPADLYLRAGIGSDSAFFDRETQSRIAALPGIQRAEFLRSDSIVLATDRPRVALLARDIDAKTVSNRLPLVRQSETLRDDATPAWINEAVAEVYRVTLGDTLALPIGGKLVQSTVAGIWRDYGRQQGAVVIPRRIYINTTGDDRANDAGLWLREGISVEEMKRAIEALSSAIDISTPSEIRAASLRIFDRTFAVTYGLEAVAITIGLAGLAAGFSALVLARRREFGVLRHLGMTTFDVARMLAAQAALVALLAIATGLVVGFVISLILIYVVNRQSFHWGMDLFIPWMPLATFVVSIFVLALATAIASGRSAMSQDAVRAVKDDW